MTIFPVLFKTCGRVLKYLVQIVRIFIADGYDRKYCKTLYFRYDFLTLKLCCILIWRIFQVSYSMHIKLW